MSCLGGSLTWLESFSWFSTKFGASLKSKKLFLHFEQFLLMSETVLHFGHFHCTFSLRLFYLITLFVTLEYRVASFTFLSAAKEKGVCLHSQHLGSVDSIYTLQYGQHQTSTIRSTSFDSSFRSTNCLWTFFYSTFINSSTFSSLAIY